MKHPNPPLFRYLAMRFRTLAIHLKMVPKSKALTPHMPKDPETNEKTQRAPTTKLAGHWL
ncbi:MAG: hypothetical protein ACI4B9_01890 [Eggerthellaceae bacterium]